MPNVQSMVAVIEHKAVVRVQVCLGKSTSLPNLCTKTSICEACCCGASKWLVCLPLQRTLHQLGGACSRRTTISAASAELFLASPPKDYVIEDAALAEC